MVQAKESVMSSAECSSDAQAILACLHFLHDAAVREGMREPAQLIAAALSATVDWLAQQQAQPTARAPSGRAHLQLVWG
jgi:hypothetical protein